MRNSRVYILAVVVILLMISGNATVLAAKQTDLLTAAFVRGGDLWIKSGGVEKQLTRGQYVRNPKWSADGKWIAYTSGEEGQELRLWYVQTGQSHLVSPQGGANFQWSPRRNQLAFLVEQQLNVINSEKLAKPMVVAKGIGNYSWLPDGKGFIASSASELLPSGNWTPVNILTIPFSALDDPAQVKILYVLPKPSDDFFAIGTSTFKWSASEKWIAFLATPTASLSADSNFLCVLSSDGASFKTIDEMLNNPEWFDWASKDDTLAYIGGVGREALTNKQLRTISIPDGKPFSYTPPGYVDQAFTWQGNRHLIASRAAEAKPTNELVIRPFPHLVKVKLNSHRYKELTDSSTAFGDYNPQTIQAEQLSWVRSNRETANVLVAGYDGRHPSVWIANIDLGANFYEVWRWSSVLSFYK